jgi:hypothetical protein
MLMSEWNLKITFAVLSFFQTAIITFICLVLEKLIIPFCGNCLSKRVFIKV